MAPQRRLRVYYGPDDRRTVALEQAKKAKSEVQIPLCELANALVEATQNNRLWIQDLGEETVSVSTDLYEVIHAYQHYKRRPSA